ncbi:MAG TPA: hypothetical protein VM370_12260 [Candidatus Thermoplasmatota archaeon]|nr:hypothetical protein [Candidatus Thermoplasmatota archaeon]
MADETSRAILYLLYEGRTFDEIFQLHPNLTVLDVSRAAGEGLRALEEEAKARPETREERIARVRLRHARAFTPWTEDEDARLALRWREGASIAELSRALERPRGALTMRLEKVLGAGWRELRQLPRQRTGAE